MMRRFAMILLAIFISMTAVFSAPSLSMCAPARDIPSVYTTLPWITSMARFIVGSTIDIHPLSVWNGTGALRNVRRVPNDGIVIALDPSDAQRYGLKPGRAGLFFLYENMPLPTEKRVSLSFDASALPFLSQRFLIVVSSLLPENYSFYQRRLAEFQSRMESTLEVGRSQIQGMEILDLSGAASPWVRAAALKAVRPPEYLWTAWTKGEHTRELSLAVDEAYRRGWWIVTDAWTPKHIQDAALRVTKKIYIAPPSDDQDFFVYLHDIYLQMWNLLAKR
jgi:hypothetical protein